MKSILCYMTISPNSLTYLCELTEFPKLFAKTYWGGFEYESKKDDELIKNRNDFAKEYN